MLICHLSIFFCQVSVEIFCSFLMGLLILLLLSFKSSLHILGNTAFFIIYTCLLQIFSSSLWLVFSFFWQYLSESNIFNLNSSFLSLSWIVPLVVYLKNDYSRSPRFSPMLSSWSFTVYILCLCLWSVLFYFLKGISSVTRSIFFFHLMSMCSIKICWKPVFSLLYFLCSFVKVELTLFMGFCF